MAGYGRSGSGGGGGGGGGGGVGGGGGSDDGGGSLEETIPGTPGVDYPVYAEVPDTGFSCDGRVNDLLTFVIYKVNPFTFRSRVESMQTQLQSARHSISVPWETPMET